MGRRVTVLGIPYDEASSFLRGAADAPPLIRAELHSPARNMFTEDGIDLAAGAAGSILTDAGDLAFAAGVDPRSLIQAAVDGILSSGDSPLLLGGDHAVTYPAVRAVASRQAQLTVVHIDAHPDLYDEFDGDRYSHACPFARIMEEGLATRLVQIGIRAATRHQREQARRFGVEMVEMRDLPESYRLVVDTPVYLSVDIDALDPSFAPGVSHREPGGLTVRQLLKLVRQLRGRLVAADIVEYNPRMDVAGCTAAVAAKILKEIAGVMLGPPERREDAAPLTE